MAVMSFWPRTAMSTRSGAKGGVPVGDGQSSRDVATDMEGAKVVRSEAL